jgi:Gluconate 2-dehydrogenase subunit 3
MTRRDAASVVLSALGAAGAAEFFGPWLRADAPPEADRFAHYVPQFFSREEMQMLDAFTAILIPSDETPGARDAHVAAFIDFVVNAAAEYEPELQEEWRGAMRLLRGHRFAELSGAEQAAVVEKMSEAGDATFQLIKEMAVHAFYTSRVGLIDVLEYKGNAYLTEFPGCTHAEHQQV